MNFEEKYHNIKNLVAEDMELLENKIIDLFKEETEINKELRVFLTSPAKRLRPVLGFLFLKASLGEVNPKRHDILLAVELIHNATLIHDDIIDNAKERRQKQTLNTKFDNNLAVIAGDFLLSTAMEKIISTNNIQATKLCTSALKKTCLGEINQYFHKFKIPSIDDYIEKSKNKTALLFEVGILSSLLVNEKKVDENLMQKAKEFSQNFGIAFQIRDDLINILNTKKLDISDIDSGIYTSPIIFAVEKFPELLSQKDILSFIKKTRGIEKTKTLMDNYFSKSVLALKNIEENVYKKALKELTDILKNDI